MAMRREGRLLMAVHHLAPPTYDEWRRWLSIAGSERPLEVRTMVEVFGSIGPGAKQRAQLAMALKNVDIRTAVLTDSLRTRGFATAVAWLGIPIRAFGAGRYRAAGEYLGLSDDELATALTVLAELRHEAGVAGPPARAIESI